MAITIKDMRKFGVFAGLTDEELERIIGICEEKTFNAGEVIFEENLPSKTFYLLDEGRIALSLSLPNETRVIVRTISASECFAWSALVEPFRTTAQSKAVESSRVISISADKLFPLFDDDCHTGFVIYNHIGRVIGERLTDTRAQLLTLTYG